MLVRIAAEVQIGQKPKTSKLRKLKEKSEVPSLPITIFYSQHAF